MDYGGDSLDEIEVPESYNLSAFLDEYAVDDSDKELKNICQWMRKGVFPKFDRAIKKKFSEHFQRNSFLFFHNPHLASMTKKPDVRRCLLLLRREVVSSYSN